MMKHASHSITEQVYDFYQNLHFNEGDDIEKDIEIIRSGGLISGQLLPSFLKVLSSKRSGAHLVEAGCGVGWLSLSIALQMPDLAITALDYSDRALNKAKEYQQNLCSTVSFQKVDLMEVDTLKDIAPADYLVSIGVLHHCAKFPIALANALKLLDDGGHALIGLYHQYGRAPLLEHFMQLRDAGNSEEFLQAEYGRLDSRPANAKRKTSWFLDQILHPHETQHTVAEVLDLVGDDFEMISNSITGATKVSAEQLNALEKDKYNKASERLAAGFYDPGFFLVHLKKG